MQYRQFGSLDWQVSALGFGCMRFPTVGANNEIDEPEAIRMVRHAIDQGVNYIDTAYGYHGGNSERMVAKILKDGYRAKVRLATKLPPWEVKEAADFDRLLNEQLAKLQVETIDYYLLHALNAESWHKIRDLDVLRWAEGAIADERIRYLGFSFHDQYEVFQEIVDAYDRWTFCQIQYNYMDEDVQAGTKGLEYAAAKGLAVVVMEPLLGGKLVNPPEPVQAIWDLAPVKRGAAEWALQWLWNRPEVSTVLSGMSTMDQVDDNLASASRSTVGLLSGQELGLVAQVAEQYNTLCPIPCTNCKYCMPCPNGVNIPHNFSLFNNGVMYNAFNQAREWYGNTAEAERASACIQCGQCEPKCPQGIAISQWLPVVDRVLGLGEPFAAHMAP
jgi:hypothetical protein